MQQCRRICLGAIVAIGLAMPQVNVLAKSSSMNLLDGVAMTINGNPVTTNELNDFYYNASRKISKLSAAGNKLPPPAQMRLYIKNQYINRELQLQMAELAGIKVTEQQLEEQIHNVLAQHHQTRQQFLAKLKSEGYTYNSFKQELSDEMTISMLQREVVGPRVKINEADIQQMTQQLQQSPRYASGYNLIDYVIPLAKESFAKSIKKDLERGLAVPSSVEANHMGWQSQANLPDLFVDALSNNHGKKVVGPVKAENGYHVLQIKGVRKAKAAMPTKAQISQAIYMKKFNEELIKWLKEIRSQAQVKDAV